MTAPKPFLADIQRDSLRARIEAAERRNAERTLAVQAREAAIAAVDYTRAHPLTVIGGALALGLAIGLLTRPGRAVARRVVKGTSDAVSGAATTATSGAKRAATRGGAQLGTLLGEAVMGFILTAIDEAIETGRKGQERAGELTEAASTEARKLSGSAAQAAETATGRTKELARHARTAATKVVKDLTRKTKG